MPVLFDVAVVFLLVVPVAIGIVMLFPVTTSGVMLVKLFGAVGPFEFVALARDTEQGNGSKQDGE